MSGGLLMLIVLAGVVYLVMCAVFPYKNCRRCGGSGRHRSAFFGGWRPCPTCNATGYRRRLLLRLIPRRPDHDHSDRGV
jgi:hypothetical protein